MKIDVRGDRPNIPLGPIKIGLLGDEKVGKTSISNSFFGIKFKEDYIYTIGSDRFKKIQQLDDGEEVKLAVWDTAGQERFRSISLKAVRYVEGIILVFDVTNRKSFDNIKGWLSEIQENIGNPIIILFGNKVDVDKEKWSLNEIEIGSFAKENNLEYFEISAKNRKGIDKGSSYLAKKINDKRKEIFMYYNSNYIYKEKK